MIASSWARRHKILTRLGVLGAAVAVAAGTAAVASSAAAAPGTPPAGGARASDTSDPGGQSGWVTSWAASPQVPVPGTPAAAGFDNQTVSNIVFTSAGGTLVRLVLTNVFGTTPLQIGDVTVAVAVASDSAAVVPSTVHRVTVGGSTSFQIPPGAQVL